MGDISASISNIINNNIKFFTEYLQNLSQIVIVLIDRDKHIIDCNQGFLEILNMKEKPFHQKITKYISSESKKIIFPVKNNFKQIRLVFLTIDKTPIVLEGYIKSIENFYLMLFEKQKLTYNELIKKMSVLNNELTNMTRELNKRNIELKKANEIIKKLAKTDTLTNLLNRRAFKEVLHRNISLSKRHNLPLTLIMVDIDHFK